VSRRSYGYFDDAVEAALRTGCTYVAEHMDVREQPSRDSNANPD